MKSYVLDTNVLLHDPYSIYKFGENEVVIPAIVLEEVDSKKRLQDEVGKNARVVSREIDSIRQEGKISKGISLASGGSLKIELNHISFQKLKGVFHEETNDNRILAVAMNLQEDYPDRKVVLVSNDVLVRIKADVLGLETEPYENDRLIDDYNLIHKGYHEVFVSPEIIDEYFKGKQIAFEKIQPFLTQKTYIKDFFILKNELNPKHNILAKRVRKGNQDFLVKLNVPMEKPVWGIMPKNVQQKMLFELLFDEEVELVAVTGKAGTGKTLLALAAALKQTLDEKAFKKVLVARPVVPLGKGIGYIPGEVEDKLRPWMQPIYDNLEFLFNTKDEQELEKVMNGMNGQLKVEALSFIRGRSIPEQWILIDEAQNLTVHEIKSIVTRCGEKTKIVFVGDPEQIDHPYLDSTNNGLTYLIEKMKPEDNVGVIHLEKTERSGLAERAAILL